MEYSFFNIFITNHFETNNWKFQCFFDSKHMRDKKDFDIFTHVATEKTDSNLSKKSYFRVKGNEIDDIVLLLSIAQDSHIFCENHNWGTIGHREHPIALFLSNEIGDFLNKSLNNLKRKSNRELDIIRTAALMFYQAKFLEVYDDVKYILMMNCFEYLISAIYRSKKGHRRFRLTMGGAKQKGFPKRDGPYYFVIKEFGYQKYINNKLRQNDEAQRIGIRRFKAERKVRTFYSLQRDFEKMRNWIAHGRQHKKPKLGKSPSDTEFTFLFRLECFIRIILIDMIYANEYERKFDLLYQLILEQNVRVTLTPDMSYLKFHE